jgi:two-component sensor histidine kinase
VVSSLLAIQSKYVKDPDALAMFKESQNRVKSIATVHQKLYQAQDLARIDCAEYLTQLGTSIFRSYGVSTDDVALAVSVEDVQLGIDTVIPCGLIVNELITNSLKHAFPNERHGRVHVELAARGDGAFCLAVGDDGVGMATPHNVAEAESLGLQIVATLTEQLDGRLDVHSNGGTEFRITFKELNYTPRR